MAVERQYRLSPRAAADLEDIWLYSFQNWSAEQADRYILSVIEALASLAAGRKAGRPVDIRQGYLKYAVGSHLIFYRLSGEFLDVIRVLHQRMDVERHLK